MTFIIEEEKEEALAAIETGRIGRDEERRIWTRPSAHSRRPGRGDGWNIHRPPSGGLKDSTFFFVVVLVNWFSFFFFFSFLFFSVSFFFSQDVGRGNEAARQSKNICFAILFFSLLSVSLSCPRMTGMSLFFLVTRIRKSPFIHSRCVNLNKFVYHLSFCLAHIPFGHGWCHGHSPCLVPPPLKVRLGTLGGWVEYCRHLFCISRRGLRLGTGSKDSGWVK